LRLPPLTKYGRLEVILATVCLLAACFAICVWSVKLGWWLGPLAAAPVAALYVWVLAFFRDPERATPEDPGLIVAPADGRVTDVTNIGADSKLGRDGVRIGIFMNVLNVHVNRSPVTGVVESVEHHRGAFLDARNRHASERNESTTIRLSHDCGGRRFPVVVRQIAGCIARRIVTDLREGQTVRRGRRIGMIKFGSRLEVLLPAELVGQIRVQVGASSRAGETVLAEARQGDAQ